MLIEVINKHIIITAAPRMITGISEKKFIGSHITTVESIREINTTATVIALSDIYITFQFFPDF